MCSTSPASGWCKRGQDGQALGRSRGGFSTNIHLKTDFDGLYLAFDLTGGEKGEATRIHEFNSALAQLSHGKTRTGTHTYESISLYRLAKLIPIRMWLKLNHPSPTTVPKRLLGTYVVRSS